MTFSLRRKHRTIRRPTTAIRTAISLAVLGWATSAILAQSPLKPLPSSGAGQAVPRTIQYRKDAAPPAAVKSAIQSVNFQEPGGDAIPLPQSVLDVISRATDGNVDPKELFALRTEAEIQRAIVKESPNSIYSKFPENYTPLSTVAFAGRSFEPRTKHVEPAFICHHRLYFEERNAERYGWELGTLQPFVSTAYFFSDLFVLPYKFGTRVCDRWECSAGKCLPGDPVPYLIYPVEFSVTGAMLQAGTVVGLYALFP